MRNYFTHNFYLLCNIAQQNNDKAFTNTMIETLIQNIPSSENAELSNCKAYFSLLCLLIKQEYHPDDEDKDQGIDFKKLIAKLFE